MAAVAAIAGVGMMVCCSSSVAALMMSGEEETPATGGGGAGPSAPTTTTFFESEIPNDAMVIDVGEIPMGQIYNSPKDSTDEESTYYFNLQGDGQMVWVKRGTGTQWAMGSHTTMPNTKMYFQGDGNICARGSSGDKCIYSHDSTVPAGQHKLVGTKEGLLYVDHGTGVAGRSVIFTPPTATETYVLPY